MITQILRALNDWIDRRSAHDVALLSVARQFAIELHLAKCLHGHKPDVMGVIATIAGGFIEASDRNDLNGMKTDLSRMQEWTW
jgi:hypothetical protein